MKKLRTAFVTGLLVLVPLMVSINILRWFVTSIDTAIKNYFPPALLERLDFPGFGLLIALAIIASIGLLTQNFVGQWAVNGFDTLIRRLPFVGGLYGGIRKFLETILNPQSDQFQGVVLVRFPHSGLYSIGFRTGKPDPKLTTGDRKNLVNVFVPCTPNPTSGFYLLVPENEVFPIDMSVQEAFRTVVSMGLVTSDSASKTTN